MRVVWLLFGGLLAATGSMWWLRRPADSAAPALAATRATVATTTAPAALPGLPVVAVSQRLAAPPALADSLVRFALAQLGAPYVYAGTTPSPGFDCSGFVQYVYARFGIATPHSTALLIGVGRPVPRAQARPGDLVVFTGTAPGSTTPGHAGIVISAAGELPLRFVHASSARTASGVKVSAVEGSGYERRFMGVRRVI